MERLLVSYHLAIGAGADATHLSRRGQQLVDFSGIGDIEKQCRENGQMRPPITTSTCQNRDHA